MNLEWAYSFVVALFSGWCSFGQAKYVKIQLVHQIILVLHLGDPHRFSNHSRIVAIYQESCAKVASFALNVARIAPY